MRAILFSGLILTTCLSSTTPHAEQLATAPQAQTDPLDRFRALQGEWVATEGEAKGKVQVVYRVTGGNSAVVETLFPGSAHEMVTIYHRDGNDLVLTHYCAAGNQPRMRAKRYDGKKIVFNFDGGTNFTPDKDMHMHQAWIEFVSADELRSEWTSMREGTLQPPVRFALRRK